MRARALLMGGFFGALLVARTVSAAAPPTIPIDDFVREPKFAQPRLSPDGKHLAVIATAPIDGRDVPLITVVELPGMRLVSTVRMPVFQVPLRIRWVSDTRLVVAKGKEIGALDAPYDMGEILTVKLDGSKQNYLYGREMFASSSHGDRYDDDKGWGSIVGVPTPPNGHVWVGEKKWDERARHSTLYDINAENAIRTRIADIPIENLRFVLQQDGTPRLAVGGGSNARLIGFRRDPGKDSWSPIPADKLGAEYEPLGLTADNLDVYVLHSDHGAPDSLLRENLETGERIVVASDPHGSQNLVVWGHSPREPFAAATQVDVPKLHYFAAGRDDAQLHQALSRQFPGQFVQFENFSQDGQKLVFSVRSDRDPGSFYLLDRADMKADRLFQVEPWIVPAQMAERRPLSFKARDGLELHGYLTLPPGRDAKHLPLVLLPHGGPHGVADTWFYETDAQFLANRGYAVLQVNFRGSGGRGVAFRLAGYRQWGAKIQSDLADAVRWAIGQGVADAERVCIYGGSFGGYSALMAPVREPGLFKCAVGYAGLYDLASLYERDNTVGETLITNVITDYIGRDPAELTQNSPTHLAAQVKLPVLMVHGTEDKTTPVAQARAMRDALVKAGNPPEWLEVPGEGHGFYLTKNRALFYQRLEAFLAKHIGAGAPLTAAPSEPSMAASAPAPAR